MSEHCQIGPNHITCCDACGKLIYNQLQSPREAFKKNCDDLERHIAQSPKCKEYYDNLPTFDDIKGIWKGGE